MADAQRTPSRSERCSARTISFDYFYTIHHEKAAANHRCQRTFYNTLQNPKRHRCLLCGFWPISLALATQHEQYSSISSKYHSTHSAVEYRLCFFFFWFCLGALFWVTTMIEMGAIAGGCGECCNPRDQLQLMPDPRHWCPYKYITKDRVNWGYRIEKTPLGLDYSTEVFHLAP